jgi:hypothetical protein
VSDDEVVALRIGTRARLLGSIHAPTSDALLGGASVEDASVPYPPLTTVVGQDAQGRDITQIVTKQIVRVDETVGGGLKRRITTYTMPMDGNWQLHVGGENFRFIYAGGDPALLSHPDYLAVAHADVVEILKSTGAVTLEQYDQPLDTALSIPKNETSVAPDQPPTETLPGGEWFVHSLDVDRDQTLAFADAITRFVLDGSVNKNNTDPLKQQAVDLPDGARLVHFDLDRVQFELWPGLDEADASLLTIGDGAKIIAGPDAQGPDLLPRDPATGAILRDEDGKIARTVWTQAAPPDVGDQADMQGTIVADNIVIGSSAKIYMSSGYTPDALDLPGAAQPTRIRLWGRRPGPSP